MKLPDVTSQLRNFMTPRTDFDPLCLGAGGWTVARRRGWTGDGTSSSDSLRRGPGFEQRWFPWRETARTGGWPDNWTSLYHIGIYLGFSSRKLSPASTRKCLQTSHACAGAGRWVQKGAVTTRRSMSQGGNKLRAAPRRHGYASYR
jgi:hypothetical protein